MKKIFVILVAFALPFLSQAQNNNLNPKEKAKVILDKVSEEYNGYKTIEADFKYILENRKNEDFREVQEGTIKLKDSKFRISLGSYVIICDNKNVWTYLKDANEVQVNNYEPKEMKMNPTEMFTIYKKGFLYGYKGEKEVNGEEYYNIELTPEDKSKSYYKVRLLIDKDTYRVKKTKIFEQDGGILTYNILSYKVNQSIPNSLFTFQKNEYPNVTVIDLRK